MNNQAASRHEARLSGVSHELSEVPLTGERQMFVAMTPDVVIELVTEQQPLTP